MRYMDFSSWQAAKTTVVGLAVFTMLGMGIRMLMMQTMQQRRERRAERRQSFYPSHGLMLAPLAAL